MSEEKKQKLKKYQKNYCGAKMSQYNNEQNSFLIFDLIVYAVIQLYTIKMKIKQFFNCDFMLCTVFRKAVLNPYIYIAQAD